MAATVIRIKRKLDEEPTENIFIRSKRSRPEKACEGVGDLSSDETSTVLMRVGTVESKEEPVEPLVIRAIKKGWELKENYKRLGSGMSSTKKSSLEAKRRSVSKRYKIITQSRGIGNLEHLKADDDDDNSDEVVTKNEGVTKKWEKDEGAESQPCSSMDVTYFDAVLANEAEEIITCNGVPMDSEKYVYDIFYSTHPVKWEDVMEKNVCRIETQVFETLSDSDSDDGRYDEDDDENEECNWRNDYPDYDDSPYEDEEDYLNSQIRRFNFKRHDTDESYDQDDYEEEGFDSDGNLVIPSNIPPSLLKLMKDTHLEDKNSDTED